MAGAWVCGGVVSVGLWVCGGWPVVGCGFGIVEVGLWVWDCGGEAVLWVWYCGGGAVQWVGLVCFRRKRRSERIDEKEEIKK